MSGYIKKMNDLEAASYGIRGGNTLLKAGGTVAGFGTAHGGESLLTGLGSAGQTMGDLYNLAYGQKVWSMLNREVNPLSLLAKRPYTSSGWRVLKSRPQGGSTSEFGIGTTDQSASENTAYATPSADEIGGVGENAALESAGFFPMAPEYAKCHVRPKTIAHMFEFSELAMELAAIDDGVGDIRAIVREDMGKHHAETQSKMLLMPFEHYDNASYAAMGNNYTSLMKVVSSAAEIAELYDADQVASGAGNSAIPDGLLDLFGLSRTTTASGGNAAAGAGSFLDAEVDFGSATEGTNYASGGARVLTLSILNAMIRRLRQNGANPKVILTGYDTIQHISDLLQSQERFMDRKEIVPSHNGVRGVKGSEVGFRVATYYDIPIIPTKDMPTTGASASLSDMLILDTDHLWLSVMKPTQYFEDGITNGNPFGVKKLGNQGMYRTIGEVCCSFLKGQGKITNLKSA